MPRSTPQEPESRSILVVDDSEIDRFLLSSILEADGFTVFTAPDGPTARRIARAARLDAILMDVMMPGEDGLQTCARLKADAATAHIPVIFLSAIEDSRTKVKGFQAGAVDYVTKPPDRDEVLARVSLHVRLHRTFQMHIREQAERLRSVQTAQGSLLTDPRSVPSAKAGVYHRSLHEAGGDFYEILDLGAGVTGYFVADVSGHDLGVSMILSALKAILQQGAKLLYTPREIMLALNAVLSELLGEEQFVTACLAVVNRRRGRLTVVSAAAPPIVHIRADGSPGVVGPVGDVLGAFEHPDLGHAEVEVSAGDRLYLCTDGCLDSLARDEGASWERFVGAAIAHQRDPVESAPGAIVARLFPERSSVTDDQLLLALDV